MVSRVKRSEEEMKRFRHLANCRKYYWRGKLEKIGVTPDKTLTDVELKAQFNKINTYVQIDVYNSNSNVGVEESGVQVADTGIHTESENKPTSYSMELEKFFVALDYGRWIEEQRLQRIRDRIGGKAGLLFDRPSTRSVYDGDMSYKDYMLLLDRLKKKQDDVDREQVWWF